MSARRLLALIALLVALLVAPSAARAAARTVAVLYFDNDTGDAANQYLGKALADMMVTDLSTAPGVQVVEREKLEALLAELKLQRTRYFDPKTAQKIGKGLGAEYAVAGSFASVAPAIRLDVRVIQIATGKVIKASQVSGQKDRFFELERALVDKLVDGLAVTLSAPDRQRVAAAVAANRVDDLGTALDYGKGIDLRDRGDLQSASREMQKVVERAPGFALAKSRYLEIMKQVYAARGTRAAALSDSERRLEGSIDRHIAAGAAHREDDWEGLLEYRVLRGQLLLARLAAALGRPAREYLPLLGAYVDNQEKLIDEAAEYARRHPSSYLMPRDDVRAVDEADVKLLRELGLGHPHNYPHGTPHELMGELAIFLVFGLPPAGGSDRLVEVKRAICYYKLDAAWPREAVRLLERGVEVVAARAKADPGNDGWRDRETIDLVQTQAQVLLALGKTEDAVAKLQGLLTRYPKSRKFAETDEMIRVILDGSGKMSDGTPLAPPCDDPR
jgi:TolB-like protein